MQKIHFPPGYKQVVAQEQDIWFTPSEGAVLEGRLIGRFARKDGNGHYYQIEALRPCRVQRRGPEGDFVAANADPGEVISIDERAAYSQLQDYTDSDGKFAVFLQFVEKVSIKNNRTMWKVGVGVKELQAPTKPIGQKKSSEQVDDMGAPY